MRAGRAHDHRGRLVLPGFIDTHVHSPQLDVIASYGTELLDWLDTYTFPAERALRRSGASPSAGVGALPRRAARARHDRGGGVPDRAQGLGRRAVRGGAARAACALVAGKVPDGPPRARRPARPSVEQAERDCRELIERWHGVDRLAYALTVRFAPTSTPAQLAMAGRLVRRATRALYMQTHVAENRAEVRWVHELFPEARSYLDVYARAGLLHATSVFAHGIWLDDADRARAARRPARRSRTARRRTCSSAAACSTGAAAEAPASRVSVATDVGGGTSLSMLRTLRRCLQGAGAWPGATADRVEGAARARRAAPRRRSGCDDEIG